MSFSGRLRAVIKKSGLKREEFAEKTGKSRGQLFKYLGEENTPTADFFQGVKSAFPWVNIEWLITGIGEMEARPDGGRHQVITSGNGHVQAGGRIEVSGGARVGGVHAGRDAHLMRERGEHRKEKMVSVDDVIQVLEAYLAPKVIEEIKGKLTNQ